MLSKRETCKLLLSDLVGTNVEHKQRVDCGVYCRVKLHKVKEKRETKGEVVSGK